MTGLPAEVRAATERWIERVVIGQGFCPFAAAPYAQEDVLLELLPATEPEALEVVYRRACQMREQALPETTLLVAPEGLASFDDFLSFQQRVEDLFVDSFAGTYVTAGFHPDYTFAEYPPDSPVHEIHRSPYPILQLLRQSSVAFAKTSSNLTEVLRRNRGRAEDLDVGWFQGRRSTTDGGAQKGEREPTARRY